MSTRFLLGNGVIGLLVCEEGKNGSQMLIAFLLLFYRDLWLCFSFSLQKASLITILDMTETSCRIPWDIHQFCRAAWLLVLEIMGVVAPCIGWSKASE